MVIVIIPALFTAVRSPMSRAFFLAREKWEYRFTMVAAALVLPVDYVVSGGGLLIEGWFWRHTGWRIF